MHDETNSRAQPPSPALHNVAGADTGDRERRRELAELLPLWPAELQDLSVAGRRHIISTLENALRRERTRGRAGHWTYDVARHAALLRTYRAERASLKTLLTRSQRQPAS